MRPATHIPNKQTILASKRTYALAGCAALVLICIFAPRATADVPQKEGQSLPKSKWPAPYPYRIGAGIQGLASDSTNIIVADVLKTNPTKAMEGARDNVKLKVVQVLMGRPVPNQTLSLYCHLLWIDENMTALEPPKFEKGKRYVIFLRSHFLTDLEGHKTVEYELSDQWLSVMPQRPRQAEEIAAAIRVAHGDARSDWSEAVGPLEGRLVAYRCERTNRTPIITLFLDLRNVAGGDNTVEFDLSRATFSWQVTDQSGNPVAPAAPPGAWPRILLDQKVVLEAGGSTRLSLSQTGGEIAKNRSGYLSLTPGKAWSFERSDKTAYFLSGRIIIPFGGKNVWSGKLEFPKFAIPLD